MTKHPRWEIYRESSGRWKWRFVSQDGEVLVSSAKGYCNAGAASQSIRRLMKYGGLAWSLDHVDVHK